ncbi:MAG: hypothetical protein Q9160_002917 [Pyrenula sp. 1 TL-2023]
MAHVLKTWDDIKMQPKYRRGETILYRTKDAAGHIVLRKAVIQDLELKGNNWAYRLRSDQENLGSPVSIHNRRNPFLRPPKRHHLPIVVAGTRFEAIPDTGAMVNAITEDFLDQLKTDVHRETGREDNVVQIGNDASASALYQVSLSCRLVDSRSVVGEEQPWSFHVFRNLAAGVTLIIGRPFLDENEIMTTRSHLLEEISRKIPSPPKCMSMGPVPRSGLRMKVYINTKPVMALPDTGRHILPLEVGDIAMVEFADGTIGALSGKTAVQFDTSKVPNISDQQKVLRESDIQMAARTSKQQRYRRNRRNRQIQATSQDATGYDHTIRLYVLDNLSHEVTLSQQLLFALDAFNQHAGAMQTVNVRNALQTIFEHGEKITELNVRKTNLRKRAAQETDLRQQIVNTRDRSGQEKVERKLNDLERKRQEESQEYENALHEMERKRLRT